MKEVKESALIALWGSASEDGGGVWVCECGAEQTDAERQVGEAELDSP